jgi:hypothetical protein
LTPLQLEPLSVERKTPPPYVPAKTNPFEPGARAEIEVLVSPALAAVQVAPLLVERKTPPPQVPARICPFVLTARALTSPPYSSTCCQKLV